MSNTSKKLPTKKQENTEAEESVPKRKKRAKNINPLASVINPCDKCPLHPAEGKCPVWDGESIYRHIGPRDGSEVKRITILIGAPINGRDMLSREATMLVENWVNTCTTNASVYIVPIVKCPYNKEPPKKAIVACQERLRKDLRYCKPDVILCLGKAAAIPFGLSGSIKELYNRVYDVQPIYAINNGIPDMNDTTPGCKLVVTYDPIKFIDDYKVRSSVEAAFKQADRLAEIKEIKPPDRYYLCESPKEFEAWVERHITDSRLKDLVHSFDIETNGRPIHPKTQFEAEHPPKLRCVGFSWAPGTALCVPVEDDYEGYLPILKKFMESGIKFIGHNVAYDYFFLRLVNGIETKNIVGDTMLMAYMLNPGKGKYGYGLKPLAAELTSLGGYETDMKSTEDVEELDPEDPEGKKKRIVVSKWESTQMDVMAPYNCADCDSTLQIWNQYVPIFTKWEMWRAQWIMTKAIVPLGEMEHNGFLISKDWVDASRETIEEYAAQWDSELKELTKDIPDEYKDWNSPQKMGELLYDEDKLNYEVPVLEEKPGFVDDDEDSGNKPTGDLTLAAIDTPFTQTLRKYRRATKLLATYFNGYLVHYGLDHRLRADFNLTGTATGRLSSSGDCNL